ncbi:hypothetical protein NA57DRAFT_56905 [Rhizodiscina lignyota]|uniref:Uncharacterized protein n=1 Tax=Rhizodiscina lignyota TaxID=1504668 RepID=A0A9P4IDL6_9PEZI|nr:hypothetical protein NA57DRAFT_56905 [Rhizodiscina lignyota]
MSYYNTPTIAKQLNRYPIPTPLDIPESPAEPPITHEDESRVSRFAGSVSLSPFLQSICHQIEAQVQGRDSQHHGQQQMVPQGPFMPQMQAGYPGYGVMPNLLQPPTPNHWLASNPYASVRQMNPYFASTILKLCILSFRRVARRLTASIGSSASARSQTLSIN